MRLRRLACLAVCVLAGWPPVASAADSGAQPRLVILFAPCSVSKHHLQPYDANVHSTPNLRAFAERSVVFLRHQTEAGMSGLAYASIFSGAQADHHGIYRQPSGLADEIYLIAEAFADDGYETFYWAEHTAASEKLNYHQGVSKKNLRAWYQLGGNPRLAERTQSIVEILDKLDSDPDYKAFVMTTPVLTHSAYSMRNWQAFHQSYPSKTKTTHIANATRLATLYRSNAHLLTWNFGVGATRLGLSGVQLRHFVHSVELLYESNVNLLDQVFGALLAEIDARGFREQSLIAFTADHGEVMYRENAPFKWSHGLQLAPEALNVPLILSAPGLAAGRYPGVTRSIDVFPTLAGLAGVPIGPERGIQGVDLSPALRGSAPPPKLLGPSHTAVLAPSVFKQMYEPMWQEVWSLARGFFPEVDVNLIWVTLRDVDTVYKHKKVDGDRWGIQVYDLAQDPGETTNLYDPKNPRHAEMVTQLADYKARLVKAYGQSRANQPLLPEDEEAELLRELGYIR